MFVHMYSIVINWKMFAIEIHIFVLLFFLSFTIWQKAYSRFAAVIVHFRQYENKIYVHPGCLENDLHECSLIKMKCIVIEQVLLKFIWLGTFAPLTASIVPTHTRTYILLIYLHTSYLFTYPLWIYTHTISRTSIFV